MKCLLSVFAVLFVFTNVQAQMNDNVATFSVGDCSVSVLAEKMRTGNKRILIGASAEALQKYLPDGTFPTEVNAFLVRTPDRNILIDAGLGADLFVNLKSLTVTAEQIHTILLTHTHGDHIGGLLQDDKKAFPNADLYLSEAEYDFVVNGDNKRSKDVLDAYKDKLKLFVPEKLGSKENNLFPEILAIEAYGHTPGHTAYLIQSKKSSLLIWGDLAHVMPIQMPHPEIAVTYDSDAKQATDSRIKILDYVLKNEIPIGGMHIIFPAVGTITASRDSGYTFTPYCP
jgi:glyoxylase-like metal-dependent hydrolase (beta-lactamase superfamily II)